MTMTNKLHILLLPALLVFTACPGGNSTDAGVSGDQSPALSEITEESALEDANKILKEIDSL